MFSRKNFIKNFILFIVIFFIDKKFSKIKSFANQIKLKPKMNSSTNNQINHNFGVAEDGFSDVYKVQGGTSEQNMHILIERLGGIEKLISRNDIVVLKPNAQWWKQGMTNTDAMKSFMELILDSRGFRGEIIITENHQYLDFNGRGWSTDQPNGSYNYNELIDFFNKKGYKNVTAYHWR